MESLRFSVCREFPKCVHKLGRKQRSDLFTFLVYRTNSILRFSVRKKEIKLCIDLTSMLHLEPIQVCYCSTYVGW